VFFTANRPPPAVHLAESLTERRCFDPDDILTRYLAWWRKGAFDTGPTTGTVLSLIDGGTDPVEAVRRAHEEAGVLTAGCNPAHRCAPLAMAFFLHDDELAGCALREARLTH
jgi:ADP-ribosylglycohydrolase